MVKNLYNNKVAKNAVWLISSKVLQAILSIVVTIFSARFLGPSNYGLVSYAASVVSFAAPITLLGLSNIQVQEYVNHPEEEGKILGSSVIMSVFSAIACMVGVTCFSLIANANEFETTMVVALYSIMILFQGTELIMYWFQAKYLNKHYAIVSLIAYAAVTSYKLILLINGMSIMLFAVANALDYFLITMLLYILYRRRGGQRIVFDKTVAKRLFNKSKHYIIPNLMIPFFTQTDHIMIKHLIDETAVGYYTAATACAAYANFIFIAIIDAARPSVFEKRKESDEQFEKSVIRLFSVVVYLSFVFGLAMMLLSPFIIRLLYGPEYSPGTQSLMIVSWFPLFSFIGMVRNVWVLAMDRQKHLWIVNIAGALINIGLNIPLINLLGIEGAAIASLITQCFTNVIFTACFKPYRRSAVLLAKSLNPKYIFDFLKR